tara:strand:- start:25 stop:519 length:495 start_codon:yes stop_codon:yes gene_type:complete
MGNSIHGMGPQQSAAQVSNVAAGKEGTQQIKELVQDIIRDALDLSDNAGKFAVKDGNKSVKDQKEVQNPKEATHNEEAAALLNAETPDEIEKKKRKKKEFEKKLKGLSTILDQIDTSELEEEEKKEIETFQKNLKQLNHLQQQITLLDNEEAHLNDILEKNTNG